jgi:Uma2 family endonuclease
VVVYEEQQLITAAQFFEQIAVLPDDQLYELVEGEIVTVPPPKRKSSWLALEIASELRNYTREHNLGMVFGADGGFILNDTNVRVPDASFVAAARVDTMNAAEADTAPFAPDLAVEVISPSETPRSVNSKTALYLDAGAQQVWNVFPDEQVVEVWVRNAAGKLEVEVLQSDATLDGGAVLPGFSLELAALFANMPKPKTASDTPDTADSA